MRWFKPVIIIVVCVGLVFGAIVLIDAVGKGGGGNVVSQNISQVHSSMRVDKDKQEVSSYTVAEGAGPATITISEEAVPLANPQYAQEYQALLKQNEDAAGLIRVESVGIEEVIVQGGDDVDVIKATCAAGKDIVTANSWGDERIVLYGGSGGAFGALSAYEDESFCMGNAYFEVNQAGAPTRWQVFSVTQTEADTLGKMKAGALFTTGAIVMETNTLLTLAVCGDKALYIHAREVSW